jgi:hypothetical protein
MPAKVAHADASFAFHPSAVAGGNSLCVPMVRFHLHIVMGQGLRHGRHFRHKNRIRELFA